MLDVNLVDFKPPNRCARCGSHKATQAWITHARTTEFGRSTIYKFKLPLCADCASTLIKRRQLGNKILIGTGFIVAAAFALVFLTGPSNGTAQSISLQLLVLIPLAILLFSLFIAIRFLTYDRLMTFDGRYFNFTNKEFMDDFAELNPLLVKRWKIKK